MVDTSAAGIRELLRQGESDTVEFKMQFPSNAAIGSTLAAFANSRGGVLLIGVSDAGELVGLSEYRAGDAVDRLRRITASLLPEPAQIGTAQLDSKTVVFAAVDPAPAHYRPIMNSNGEIFERLGASVVLRERRVAAEKAPGIAGPAPKCTVFVAMSFRTEEEPALVDYYQAMRRAADRVSSLLELRRIDLVEGDYEISQKIMDEIARSHIVIADFTLNSPNVYFELGCARASGCTIIQTARKGTPLEFDIRNWRTIFYRNATELEEQLLQALPSAWTAVRDRAER